MSAMQGNQELSVGGFTLKATGQFHQPFEVNKDGKICFQSLDMEVDGECKEQLGDIEAVEDESKINTMLHLVHLIKTKSPSAPTQCTSTVVFDPSKVSTDKYDQYREGDQFDVLRNLGQGFSAEDVAVVWDKESESEHVMKTVMVTKFQPNEIRAWVDFQQASCDFPPALYSFRVEGNKVVMHMELIEGALTLDDLAAGHMNAIQRRDPSLVKPFALYVLKGLLHQIQAMNTQRWTHGDLHGGNIMLQRSGQALGVRVLDFGLAKKMESATPRKFKSDIRCIQLLFAKLLMGLPSSPGLSELKSDINDTLDQVTLPDDVKQAVDEVTEQLPEDEAMLEVIEEVIDIIFFKDIHSGL